MKLLKNHTRITRKRTNREWLSDLRSRGPAREQARAELQGHLVRAVLVYLSRHRGDVQEMDRGELIQLVEDCAVVALRAIEGRLDMFRDDSRFTTWAYSIAVKHAAGELRFRSHLATSTQ